MSLIHTAELAGVNVFDYLVALLRHPREVVANPAQWLPWNFAETLAGLPTGTGPPA
jgi:transposase